MALMSDRWERVLLRLSELERDASIDLAHGNNDSARARFMQMVELIRDTCRPMRDLMVVLKQRGYTAAFPMLDHYAELFRRFTICVRDQLDIMQRSK